MRKDLHEENRRAWNLATKAHNSHKVDQAKFFREGGSTLFPEEARLLGDIRGKRLVHLQCNAGQDTLSLAHLGADVTGVDISDEAIDFARKLAQDSGIAARFVRADVFDWFDEAAGRGEQYDVVFASYGALVWLSDIRAWGAGVEKVLKPGGRCVVMEFHPVLTMLDEKDMYHIAHSYFSHDDPISWEDGVGDYVAVSGEALAPMGYTEGITDFANPNPCHEFTWPVSLVIMALVGTGLRLVNFEEYPFSNGCKFFPGMEVREGMRVYPPEDKPTVPLMYGLVVEKG